MGNSNSPNFFSIGDDLLNLNLNLPDNLLEEFNKLLDASLYDAKGFELHTERPKDVSVDLKADLKKLADLRIPLFDYLIMKRNKLIYKDKFNIQPIKNISSQIYNLEKFKESFYIAFYLFMTRNKVTIDDNEQVPKFIKSVWKKDTFNNDYLDLLTMNKNIEYNLGEFFFKLSFKNMNNKVVSRLSKGIAGNRLFNIFKNYESDLDMNTNITRSYNSVKKISMLGPFIEMHPFKQPNNLRNISLNKNLQNLIVKCFSDTLIEDMLKKRFLATKPEFDNNYNEFYTFNDETFKELKTKLVDFFLKE